MHERVRQIVRTDDLERAATPRQRGKIQGCIAANPSLSAKHENKNSGHSARFFIAVMMDCAGMLAAP